MITETRFAHSHAAFWTQLLPMSEHYVRTANLERERFAKPFHSDGAPQARGVVNELATHIFSRSVALGCPASELPEEAIAASVDQALTHISRLRRWSRGPMRRPLEADIEEAVLLSTRLTSFFGEASLRTLTTFPEFPGCGWLSACSGDVYDPQVLYEVKAGERGLRSIDIRQVLCYCALNFAAKRYDIKSVCIVNPREGVYVQEELNRLCTALSGSSAVEVLGEIVEYISEPATWTETG